MCNCKIIARRGAFQVDGCPRCDTLNVHMGPITVRLDEDAVVSLQRVLSEALQSMHDAPETAVACGQPNKLN
jgi:hypothetical protein